MLWFLFYYIIFKFTEVTKSRNDIAALLEGTSQKIRVGLHQSNFLPWAHEFVRMLLHVSFIINYEEGAKEEVTTGESSDCR